MPVISIDTFSLAGAVRVRATALDPLSGLRGQAYLSARKLDQRPVLKLVPATEAETKRNLISYINERPAGAGRNNFVFTSGSIDPLKEHEERRFYLLPETTQEEQ